MLTGQTGELLEYSHLMKRHKHKQEWSISSANEFGKLAQGVDMQVEGTDTIFFINKDEIHKDIYKDITCSKSISTVCPNEAKLNRTCYQLSEQLWSTNWRHAVVKILLNSVISTEKA